MPLAKAVKGTAGGLVAPGARELVEGFQAEVAPTQVQVQVHVGVPVRSWAWYLQYGDSAHTSSA